MNYLNKSFEELINLETNKKTIMDMKADVDSFMPYGLISIEIGQLF